MPERHYLHGDFLEAADRNFGSTVYCGFCDGYCSPEHLYEEHPLEQSFVRLNAAKKAFYRAGRRGARPENAPNYFDDASNPG
jgi:formate hydrogenlyase subunit 6/NADH:ubiquinone oxidoreductase subunit I